MRATQACGPHLPDDLVLEVVKRFTRRRRASRRKTEGREGAYAPAAVKGKITTDATLGMRLYGDEESDDPEATSRWTG